jgi:hypothetical protein
LVIASWGTNLFHSKAPMTTHFLATVKFHAHRSISELAADRARICGMPLSHDVSGRYDEVPAYFGSVGQVQFTLFGPTDEQAERECVLEVMYRTLFSADEAWNAAPRGFESIFESSALGPTGYIDCSVDLLKFLRMRGFDDCQLLS